MISKKNHIIVLLLIIFTFPVIYQAIHMVFHHHSHHDYLTSNNKKASSISSEIEICFICDYEFFNNELPQNNQVEIKVFATNYCHYEDYDFSLPTLSKIYSSTRAPPFGL